MSDDARNKHDAIVLDLMARAAGQPVPPRRRVEVIVRKPASVDRITTNLPPAPQGQSTGLVAGYLNKQVFVELKSGTRITGVLLAASPDMLTLSTGVVATDAIAFMSEKLVPYFGGV